MQEMWLQSLGWEDPLEKELASVYLPGKSHRQRSLAGYSQWSRKETGLSLNNPVQSSQGCDPQPPRLCVEAPGSF